MGLRSDISHITELHLLFFSLSSDAASATATIYVKDVDNDYPTFPDNDPVSFTVGNDAAIGDTVGVLPVEDADEDFRDSVQFSIIDGNTDGYFDIYSDPYTLQGVIVVAKVSIQPERLFFKFPVRYMEKCLLFLLQLLNFCRLFPSVWFL